MAARARLSLPAAGALVAAAVVALGLLYEASGRVLGTATPPFVMAWGPRLHPLAAVSLLAAIAGVALAPRLPGAAALRRPAAYAAAVYALAVGLGLALSLMRLGLDGPTHVFDLGPGGSFEAKNEYLPGLPALEPGARFFLDRFAEMVPALPVNVAGHPPGLMLVVHALGITTATQLAALCVGVGSLAGPLAYATGRALLDEQRARVAGLLCALSPSLLLIGVTSADYLYAAAGMLAAWLLVTRPAPLGWAALAVASLLNWALLAVGAWAAVLTWRRAGPRPAAVLAVGCGAAVVALDGALWLAFGYDAIGALRATHEVYENSLAAIRPYWFWVLGSPVAWALMAGLPIAWWVLAAVARREATALALAVVIVVAAVLGFTKAETDRIWLYLVPLAALAAASVLPARRLGWVAAALVAQAVATQALFDTVW
ncbi:MAG TPA: hypothetical protein VIL49_13660 [Capillimicrobium sp.]|jgi:hypothetical protein